MKRSAAEPAVDVGDRAAVINYVERFDRYTVGSRRGLLVTELERSMSGWWLQQCGNIEIMYVYINTECCRMAIGTSKRPRDEQPDGGTVFI